MVQIKHLDAVGSASDVQAVVKNYRHASVTNPRHQRVTGTDCLATLRGAIHERCETARGRG